MTIQTQVIMQFTSHRVHVTVTDTGTISIFKHSDKNCDFEVFAPEHSLDASDYILEPLPTTYMRVVVSGDSNTVGPI